ncbi:alpha/beta fold hydrolase [Brucella cytisi]|uniref:alpha/beta fold hydrolase n=1 Tax=Brucella cytisi TaxID=407152 RepID=UPI0035E17FAB
MASFVLIHGAWHGGWCWQRLVDRLRSQGHTAVAPTLSGLAERADLLSAQIDLTTHTEDIVSQVRASGCRDVTLVAHSYGGFPAVAAVGRLGELVSHLVLLDAFLPEDGEKLLDHAPSLIDIYAAKVSEDGNWHIPPLPSAEFGVTEADQAWVDGKLTPHPVASYFEPVSLEPLTIPRRTYIRCSQADGTFLARSISRAISGGWHYVEIDAPHDAMISHPDIVASVLIEMR